MTTVSQTTVSKTTEAPLTTAPATLPATLERIVLTGFMGAGKSSAGRLLAAELGWQFLDLDTHVEQRAGASITALFALHGEPRFRRMESCALANALSGRRLVLALGGGTPELLVNRLLLEQTPGTRTVFLQASFETLYDRCMLQEFSAPTQIRPVLASAAEAAARFQQREPIYRRISHLCLDTTGLTPEAVARQVVQRLAVETAR